MTPAAEAVQRFAADLTALGPTGGSIGLAVSGGPDSLALLLLAHAALGNRCRVATVDHRLRPEAAAEATHVARICADLGVPHDILTVEWAAPPTANLQARAREERYALLGRWALANRLDALLTGHHADDQAETLLMRLARGAGVSGLAGIRPKSALIEADGHVVWRLRPLLGWRRADLVDVVAAAGIEAVDDPTNRDPRHDRTKARQLLTTANWIDSLRVSASAAALRDVEEAMDWAVAPLAEQRIARRGDALVLDPAGLPRELVRRLLLAAFARLAAPLPRGPELMRAIATLDQGGTTTLSGLCLIGGETWRLFPEPPRIR